MEGEYDQEITKKSAGEIKYRFRSRQRANFIIALLRQLGSSKHQKISDSENCAAVKNAKGQTVRCAALDQRGRVEAVGK